MISIDPQIIYEDENILVVNKPSGVTVNNSETTAGQETLQDWIIERYRDTDLFLPDRDHDFIKRNGIVHRLDKETSGVMIIAKKMAAFEALQLQFKDRLVQKTYKALAHGVVSPSDGEISAPVGRLPWSRKQFGILAGGRPSVTLYKTDKIYKKDGEFFSLLTLFPKTGRTHQIRVHLKYIGHPIFADFLYAGRKTSRRDRRLLSRVFLHAFSIGFVHPETNKKVMFQADLPEDLVRILKDLEELDEKEE